MDWEWTSSKPEWLEQMKTKPYCVDGIINDEEKLKDGDFGEVGRHVRALPMQQPCLFRYA